MRHGPGSVAWLTPQGLSWTSRLYPLICIPLTFETLPLGETTLPTDPVSLWNGGVHEYSSCDSWRDTE
jgi:hypothetical protein